MTFGAALALGACCADDDVSVTTFKAGITGHPGGIVVAPDGRNYFTEQFDDRVGWFSPHTGQGKEIDLPKGTLPHYIINGPDGHIWFTGLGGVVGSIDRVSDQVTIHDAGITKGSEPHFLLIDPTDSSKLWFTEQAGDAMARFDLATKRATEFRLPSGSRPHGATVDPDGRSLWVMHQGRDRMARIDLSGPIEDQADFDAAVTEHGGLPAGSGPHDPLFAPDGSMYITLQGSSQLARFDPQTQAVDTIDLHLPRETRGQELNTLVLAPDEKSILFNIFVSGRLGRLDLGSGEVSEISQELEPTSGPLELVRGPGRTIWFTMASLADEPGRLARLEFKE